MGELKLQLPTGCSIELPIDLPELPQLVNVTIPEFDFNANVPDLSIDLSRFGVPCLNFNVTACNVDVLGKAVQDKLNQIKGLSGASVFNTDATRDLIAGALALLPQNENVQNFASEAAEIFVGGTIDPLKFNILRKKWEKLLGNETFAKIYQGALSGRLDLCEFKQINALPVVNELGQYTSSAIKAIEPINPASIPTKVQASADTLRTKVIESIKSAKAPGATVTPSRKTMAENYALKIDDLASKTEIVNGAYESYHTEIDSANTKYANAELNSLNALVNAESEKVLNAFNVAVIDDTIEDFANASVENKQYFDKAATHYFDGLIYKKFRSITKNSLISQDPLLKNYKDIYQRGSAKFETFYPKQKFVDDVVNDISRVSFYGNSPSQRVLNSLRADLNMAYTNAQSKVWSKRDTILEVKFISDPNFTA